MTYKTLILGASYGSLLGTKLAAAGHDVTLVCRAETSNLINSNGTEVRIKLRGEETFRSFYSKSLQGKTNAVTPEETNPQDYDLICLAMQEPQYSHPAIRELLLKIAKAKKPCMSIMNMPPLPFLKRIKTLDTSMLVDAFLNASIWDSFNPALMTLCSPDPQAYRPPEEPPNVLHVGLPTNFKVSKFDNPKLNLILETLSADIENYKLDGKDVPVKLRVFDSLFVPFAKWAMLATGNYRSITNHGPQSICDAVHNNIKLSENIYDFVNHMVLQLGANKEDLVPFEKYAQAAKGLSKPSSAARAIFLGATNIERVDKLIKLASDSIGRNNFDLNKTVMIVDNKLTQNYEKNKQIESRSA